MTYRKYTCPACNGKGCRVCQNRGIVMATAEQINQARATIKKAKSKREVYTSAQSPPATENQNTPNKNWLVNLIVLSIFIILLIGAIFSWIYLKSLKPFFAGLISLLILTLAVILWIRPVLTPGEPNDFLRSLKESK